jgi:nitrogen fixation-related uncharacterized protein
VNEEGQFMSTTQIVVLVVALLVAAVIVALLVRSMKAKSREDDRARAEQLRREADERAAATLPDSQIKAERAAAEAEEARRAAEAADQRAAEARVEVAQQEAAHEDLVRAADRLDPDVDHRSDDYAPQASERLHGRPAATTAGATATAADEDADTIFDDTSRTGDGRATEMTSTVEPTEQPTTDERHAADPVEQPVGEELDEKGGTPGRPPLGGLPRRTPGAQEMPGQVRETEGGGSLFKRRDDSSGS